MKNILKYFHRYKGGIAMIALVALLAVLKLMWFDYSWWWVFAPAIAPACFIMPKEVNIAAPDSIAEQEVVDPDTVGQFTGLIDKNGKEIYEGDVVDFDNYLQGRSCVMFDSGCFRVESTNYTTTLTYHVSLHTHIIGNIHENPELMQ